MIDFRAITLDDKELIESYTLRSEIRNCDLSFANMYCWQSWFDTVWALVDGYLVIRFRLDDGSGHGYMQPIGRNGEEDFGAIIPKLAMDAHARGERLRIIGISEVGQESLSRESHKFALFSNPSNEDYIYTCGSLATLKGKRLQPKRNHLNQFLRCCPSYTYTRLCREHFAEALALDIEWRRVRDGIDDLEQIEQTPERIAIRRAFESYERLGLEGGAIYVDGRMVAFTYGSAINADTFCIHTEKGLREITGCYTAINRLFAESLSDRFTYINREEDMGNEGLRRAKLSYYPDHMQVKYTAIHLHHSERECKRLWRSVFGDSDRLIDHFLIHHFSDENMHHVRSCCDNRYVAMIHTIPFESPLGRISYIYSLATDLDFLGRKYGIRLVNEAIASARRGGFDALMLIPGEESLRDYYSKMGFVVGGRISFSTPDGYDFGTGDPELDIAMIFPLSDRAHTHFDNITLHKNV